ncbi:MAG: anhydro-N-acetylmuramic acid kinase [Methylophilaceae bacterium]
MKNLYFGVMSGTSLDGIDAILIEFKSKTINILDFAQKKYNPTHKKAFLNISSPKINDLEQSYQLGLEHAQITSQIIKKLLKKNKISKEEVVAIGYHGQTIRHRPEKSYSIQIGSGHLLAEHLNISVVSDFRNRDIVAGGQGAPLVPAFHQTFFSSKKHNRIILNIGGISNISYIRGDGKLIGFDCGPGNILMDSWCQKNFNKPFDNFGAIAKQGEIIDSALTTMLKTSFFKKHPPKSTGRELFNLTWAEKFFQRGLKIQDVQRTLLELTSQSIVNSIQKFCSDFDEIYVCGGGSKNKFLIQNLQEKLQRPISFTRQLGIPEQQVEAAAFAWLAKTAIEKKKNNSPTISGSKGERVLGVIHHR